MTYREESPIVPTSRRRAYARYRQYALVLAALLASSACGSTVQPTNQASGAADHGGVTAGVDSPSPSSAPSIPNAEATANRSAPSANVNVPSTSPSPSDTTAGTSPSSQTATTPTTGRGFTDKKVYIGYATCKDCERATNTAGFEGFSYGDQEGTAQAIIKYINAQGGWAGRQLVPVFYDMSAAASSDTNMQSACTYWTQDRLVFAVVTVAPAYSTNVLKECLAKSGVIHVDNHDWLRSESEYIADYAPNYYAPSAPTLERFLFAWVRRLDALRYFEAWDTTRGQPGKAETKIGIVGYRESGKEFIKLLTRELAAVGRNVTESFVAGSPTDNNEASVVLRFKAAGVTHVFTNERLVNFPITAESQQFRPRYAVGSHSAPQVIQNYVPKSQLTGALGAGFTPAWDVDASHDPGDWSSARTRCRKALQDGGVDLSAREDMYFGSNACDGFEFLSQAIRIGGLSAEGVRQAVPRMQSIDSAATFRTAFPNGRHDGAATIRDLGYGQECGCFRYLSATDHNF